MLNSVDNSLIDYTRFFDEILNECYSYDRIMVVLKKVNHRWLNINEVPKQCCKYGCSDVVQWVMKNSDHTLLDYEELFKITIEGNEERLKYQQFIYVEDDMGFSNILELLILQKPGMILCNIN